MLGRFGIAVLLIAFEITLINSELPIENKIRENPHIDCQTHNVVVRFNTDKAFQGHVYVRGHYEDDDCHKDYLLNRDTGGDMNIPFDKCGMRRQRMTNPKGMAMSSTVVISFHRTFITSVDRAYKINCFYLEADKEVKQSLEVSTISTIDLGVPVPMPTCTYQVLTGGPEGSVVQYARVGDKVFHKWSCSFEMPELYCMLVHSCNVDDGSGTLFEMIDQEGCSKDPVILDDLTYITDLMAGTESSVFKFADKAHLYFTCQVQLSLKHEQEGDICVRPKCNATRRFRYRRELPNEQMNSTIIEDKSSSNNETSILIDEMLSKKNKTRDNADQIKTRKYRGRRSPDNDFDLVAPPVMVLDLDDADPRGLANNVIEATTPITPNFQTIDQRLAPNWSPFHRNRPQSQQQFGICMSEMTFGFLIGVALLAGIGSIVFSTIACLIRARGKKN